MRRNLTDWLAVVGALSGFGWSQLSLAGGGELPESAIELSSST